MAAKWEKLEGNQGVLTVEVSVEDVHKGIDKAFQKVVQKVNVPGFRKGKVPRNIFIQRFGIESLYQDAIDFLLPDAYEKAIDETGIYPIDRPDIDIQQFESGKTMLFTAKVLVKPEVVLGQYKGIEVDAPSTEVSEDEVAKEITSLQERNAELAVKEDASVLGDTVIIDFEGFLDEVAFEGGQGTNYSLELGSNTFIPGFEDQLVGKTPGSNVQVHVTFPEEYHSSDLAGKAVRFDVTIHEIKTKVLPELTDEFAKDVDQEVSSLDELKDKIRKRMEHRKEHDQKHAIEDQVIEAAATNTTVDIPDVMVENEVKRMLREFDQRLQSQGMDLARYYQFTGQSEDLLREQMKPDGLKRVRANLMLEQVIQVEGITVSEEEVRAELDKMASVYQMPVSDIEKALGRLDGIQQELQIRKAIQLLVAESVRK